jgi:hypothetical protein
MKNFFDFCFGREKDSDTNNLDIFPYDEILMKEIIPDIKGNPSEIIKVITNTISNQNYLVLNYRLPILFKLLAASNTKISDSEIELLNKSLENLATKISADYANDVCKKIKHIKGIKIPNSMDNNSKTSNFSADIQYQNGKGECTQGNSI